MNGKNISLGQKENFLGWSFILPMLIGFCIFSFGPIIASLIISFTNWDLLSKPKMIGIENYINVFNDKRFIQCVSNTLYFVVTMVPIILITSFIIALLLNREIKGKTFFRSAFYIPSITSTVAVSMVWLWIYGPKQGILNKILQLFGMQQSIDWLGNPKTVKPALVAMRVWQATGYYMLMFLTGLQSIPKELYEVSDLDGANFWQKTWHITIPLLRSITILVTILLIIEAFNIFEAIYVMTEGGPAGATNTLMYYIYHNAFKLYRMGYASAIAWILFIILMILTVIQFKIKKEEAYY